MSAFLPYPALSALLVVVWLALAESVAPAHLFLAAIVALVIPLAARRFLGPATHIAAPGTALRLAAVVLWDIVVSNVVVARLVLGPLARLRPAFVTVPLDVQHPQAIALLASIITMTPGTVSAVVSESGREILVHALDCADPAALVSGIKARYEQPLAEIFG